MSLSLNTPTVADLSDVADTLAGWQHDDAPLQLHPGDLGWHTLNGADETAAALRTWSRGGRVVAMGLLDGPQVLRMAFDPEAREQDDVVRQVAADVDDPARGVLETGKAAVEARGAVRLTEALVERGWTDDEPWTPFRLSLADPVPEVGLRIEEIGPEQGETFVSVHWSAFTDEPFIGEDREIRWRRWGRMTGGQFYDRARSLVGYDEHDTPVAVATVWTAGEGRPGVLEPMGVHREHRGRGHGVAITRAAAATLRAMGASSALVCTTTDNVGGTATYAAAGFAADAPVPDLGRGD